MKYIILLLPFIILYQQSSAKKRYKDSYIGGKLGYVLPTNIGGSSTRLGFADVSNAGPQITFYGKWFYNRRMSLGFDLGYQFTKGKDSFWDVYNRGDVQVNYQRYHFLVDGNYYFSHDEIRPFIGLAFGAYYLANKRDFDSNTATNQSIDFKAKDWKPGFAPQAGLLLEVSKNMFLEGCIRLDLIPNLKTEIVNDPNTGAPITKNPHGNQHQISASIGLLFEI